MNIIFLGAPGSGKGTQAEKLEKKYSIKKISTGDILRNEVKQGSELGKKVKSIVDSGGLISDDIMISLISNELNSSEYKNGFILDGFPRTLNQAKALDVFFKERSIKLNAVIHLKVEDQYLIERVSLRFTCNKCNSSYNSKYNNTRVENICDNCGSNEFSFRKDDNLDTLKERLHIYHAQIQEILPYYDKKGSLFSIDGMKTVDEVTDQINKVLDSTPNILT